MKDFDFILKGGRVLLPKKPGPGLALEKNISLGLKGKNIVFIGKNPPLPAKRTIDLTDHLITPGLVNTHTHLSMSLFRGLADNMPLRKWLKDYILPLEKELVDEDFVRTGALLSIMELIRSGVTSFQDMYFQGHATAEAADMAGVRGIIGLAVPEMPGEAGWKERILKLQKKYADNERIRFAIAPHAPYSVDPKTLSEAGAFAKEHDLPLSIHVSESLWEQRLIRKRFGKSPVEHLRRLGITGPKTVFAHCVHINETDMDIMQNSQTALSYNPESNMKLQSGIAPVTEAFRKGIKIGLGTDGAASNNNLDFLCEMDSGLKLQSLKYGDQAITCEDMAQIASMGGARAMGMQKYTGSLEEGKRADITAIHLKAPHLRPLYNPISLMTYSAKGNDVDFVMCHGRILLEKGKIQTLNEDKIFEKALIFENKIKNFLKNRPRSSEG